MWQKGSLIVPVSLGVQEEVVRRLRFYSGNVGSGAVRFGPKGGILSHMMVLWDLPLSAGMGFGGLERQGEYCSLLLALDYYTGVFEIHSSLLCM